MSEPLKILLVDDDALVLRALGRYLKRQGFDVSTAQNGAEALDAVGEHGAPDWIVTDVRMPVMDGPALVRAIRAQGEPPPQILLVTGYSALEEGDLSGMKIAGILQKPIDGRQIAEFLSGVGAA